MPAPRRHLVLDTEAASVLLSAATRDAKRAAVFEAIAAANGHRVVPTAVRCEAWWDRTQPTSSNANRLVPDDDPLDRSGASRDVHLRTVVPTASLVDAAVAVAAERLPSADVVEVLTSDPGDLEALADNVERAIEVRAI